MAIRSSSMATQASIPSPTGVSTKTTRFMKTDSLKAVQLTQTGLPHPKSTSSNPNLHQLDGKVSQLEHVFIRGSEVRFMVIQDMLKNAPMFQRLDARIKGKGAALGVGRGRAVAMRAGAQAAGRGATAGRGVVPSRR